MARSAQNHPFRGVEILTAKGYPEWVTRAILSHAEYSGVPRESRLEHALFACDEMSGFITAAALVRPSKSIMDLEAPSVVKRMKDKAFARAVNRDDLRKGAEELGLPLDEHITNVIAFMRSRGGRAGAAKARLESVARWTGRPVDRTTAMNPEHPSLRMS